MNYQYRTFGCNTADLIVIGIAHGETVEQVLNYRKSHGVEYPSVSGKQGQGDAAIDIIGVPGYPAIKLIKPDRSIEDVFGDIWDDAAMDSKLVQLGLLHASCEVVENLTRAARDAGPGTLALQAIGDRIEFTVPGGGAAVKLMVHDLTGRQIRAIDCGWKAEGRHQLRIGNDRGVKGVASKALIVRLVCGSRGAATLAVH